MKKTEDKIKATLKEQWAQVCNGYLTELLRSWELDAYYGYWIGDEVGGVYDYADGTIDINMHDIIYCVEHDVTRQQYDEWTAYINAAAEFGFATPNLQSWMRGCPRTPQEVFNNLYRIKQELNEAIKDALAQESKNVAKY